MISTISPLKSYKMILAMYRKVANITVDSDDCIQE